MFTNGPTPLVAAGLRHVRSVAHEIVVAVDDRVPVDQLGPLQAVADRVIRAEFVYPLEANLHWLHQQATGDWVLRLDGDDLVSEALLRRLATPGWDRGITHAYLQYRWLWGSPDRMLDQAPWWPDPALRLIRSTPGIAVFPQGAHQAPTVAGTASFWDTPLYHLDLVLRDEATRSAKAMGYEYENPGHRTDKGWSVSTTYYLPERLVPPPRTAPLPAVDAAVAEQLLVLAASHAPVTAPVDEAALGPVATAAGRRTPAPAPGDSRVRLVAHDPLTVVAGRSTVVTVGVVNLSGRTWDPADEPADVVGARFLDDRGQQVGHELRAPLPGPVAADDEALVRLPVPAPLPEGAAHLQVGLVQDGVAWHDAVATARLQVQAGRRVLVSTGISTFGHLGDDLITSQVLVAIARHLPDVVPTLLAHPVDGIAERFGCEVAVSPVALAGSGSRSGDGTRRSRDLVTQARLMAKGDVPADPMVAEILAPFADASALVLAPGGGLASRYSQEALMVCAVEALIARAFGLAVFVEGPSIGPIEMRRDHAALAQLLNDATRITVRDQTSADAARRIGRAVVPVVVPDPATLAVDHVGAEAGVAASWLRAHNVPADRPYAVISLRGGSKDAHHLETVRAAVEALPEHTALIFLPHCSDPDGVDDRSVVASDPWAAAHLVVWDPSLGDRAAVALVAGASCTIGTRFHLSVLAAAAGVRAVGLVGDEYDRLRIRGLRRSTGVRVVELDDPRAAAGAVADLVAAPDPEPVDHWDPEAFAEALGAALPAAPRLA
jgi:polysaccharide pyruvyl transferase WcaK-like protein